MNSIHRRLTSDHLRKIESALHDALMVLRQASPLERPIKLRLVRAQGRKLYRERLNALRRVPGRNDRVGVARSDLIAGGEDAVLRELGMTEEELAEEKEIKMRGLLTRARCDACGQKLTFVDAKEHVLEGDDQLACLTCGGMFEVALYR